MSKQNLLKYRIIFKIQKGARVKFWREGWVFGWGKASMQN